MRSTLFLPKSAKGNVIAIQTMADECCRAYQRFLDRENPAEQDAIALTSFVKRLIIDPYDTPAEKSLDGEWVHRIGQSVTRPDRALAIAFRIDDSTGTYR